MRISQGFESWESASCRQWSWFLFHRLRSSALNRAAGGAGNDTLDCGKEEKKSSSSHADVPPRNVLQRFDRRTGLLTSGSATTDHSDPVFPLAQCDLLLPISSKTEPFGPVLPSFTCRLQLRGSGGLLNRLPGASLENFSNLCKVRARAGGLSTMNLVSHSAEWI